MSGVFYGSFDLDNHSTPPTGYYVQSRPLGNMKKQQNLVPIARYEGVKKTGEWIGERTIQLQVKVVGSSRANLESLLDALYLALDQEQQHLVLHSDGRYFVADAIYAPAPLGIGNILACTVPIDFVCQQPYAYSASGSGPYDTGDLVLSLDSGMRAYPGGRSIPNTTYVFPPFLSITGGGTAFSRPTMKIYNKRVALSGIQLTTALLQNTVYTSIMVGALNAPLYPGDTLTMALNHTPPQQGDPSQTLTVSQLANVGDTTINVNSFTANYSYPVNSGGPIYTSITLVQGWTSVIIQQTTDNQYWSVSGTALCATNGSYLTFVGDPLQGISVIDSNNPGVLLNFSGTPVSLNPGATSYVIMINALSVVEAEATFCWTPRWLS